MGWRSKDKTKKYYGKMVESRGGKIVLSSGTSAKKKITPFQKLARKRGVNLEAEKKRATQQKQTGKKIQGTTKKTLSKQRQVELTKKIKAKAKAKPAAAPPKIKLTKSQVERIKAGTLKTTAETAAAVKSGEYETAEEEGIAKKAGSEALAAMVALPMGRGIKVVSKGGPVLSKALQAIKAGRNARVAAKAKGLGNKGISDAGFAAAEAVKKGAGKISAGLAEGQVRPPIDIKAPAAETRKLLTFRKSATSKWGMGAIKKGGIGKLATGQLPGIPSNVRAAGRVISFAKKVAVQFRKPTAVAAMLGVGIYTAIKESRSGEVLGEFTGMEEAVQMVGMAKWLTYEQAQETGDWDLFAQSRMLEVALFEDQDMWDEVVSKIPWANALKGLEKFRRTGIAVGLIWDEMAKREKARMETGQTDKEYWEEINKAKAEQDRAVIDYRNSERKIMFDYEQESRKASRAATRADEKKARNEDAAFWAKGREKQRELEAEDRKAIADFWTAYRKQVQKLKDDNRPSNLNFGLL